MTKEVDFYTMLMQCKRMAYVVNNSSIKTIGFSPRNNEWQAIIQFVDGSTWCGRVHGPWK